MSTWNFFQEYSPGGGARIWHPVEKGEREGGAGLRGPGLLGQRLPEYVLIMMAEAQV